MKTLNFLGICSFIILTILVSLLAFAGCRDTEADPVNPTGTLVLGEFKWPPGATGEQWELTDADVAELLAINPPPDWPKIEDPELHKNIISPNFSSSLGIFPRSATL